jgi:hypothetical protein
MTKDVHRQSAFLPNIPTGPHSTSVELLGFHRGGESDLDEEDDDIRLPTTQAPQDKHSCSANPQDVHRMADSFARHLRIATGSNIGSRSEALWPAQHT